MSDPPPSPSQPVDEDDSQVLARQLGQQARAGLDALAREALGPAGAGAERAMDLLARVAPAALVPLLEAESPPDGRRRLWRLTLLVRTELALRAAVAEAAEALLDDRHPAPAPPPGPRPEGDPPAPRVCDEALLLLRELLKSDEDALAQEVAGGLFLHLSEADKDAVIRQYRATRTWADLVSLSAGPAGAPAPPALRR